MFAQKALDDLMDAARQFIESDFNPDAFVTWRRCACDCAVTLLGEGHPHAQFFQALAVREARTSLLEGAGLPDAPEEQLAGRAVRARHLVSEPMSHHASANTMV